MSVYVSAALQCKLLMPDIRTTQEGPAATRHSPLDSQLEACHHPSCDGHERYLGHVQVVDDILDITQSTEVLGKTAGKDLLSDKTTYPSLLGIEKSKEVAQGLIAEAKAQLTGYEPGRAAPLIGLAEYIISRTN